MNPNAQVPPPGAIDAATRAAALGQGSTEPLSLAGVEVCAALIGVHPLTDAHVAAMACHDYEPDSLNGLLFGGDDGRTWAFERLAAAAKLTLPEFSKRLADIDRKFRDRVEQILAQSMRAALRRADVKVKVRSRSRVVTASAIAPHLDDMQARAYTPPLLAALRTTTDELLHDSFLDAADQVALQFDVRQRQRRKLTARQFDLDPDDLERDWQQEEGRRRDDLVAFVAAAMFAEAAARLSQPRGAPVFDPRGEQPVDPYLSPRIASDVGRVANGATLAPPRPTATPSEQPGAPFIDNKGAPAGLPADFPGGGRPNLPAPDMAPEVPAPLALPGEAASSSTGPLFDYTDQLIADVLAQTGEQLAPVVTYTWTTGDPERPFEPHQSLDGMTATEDTFWIVFAKSPDEFPEGEEAWFPGDHPGCQCDLVVTYEDPAVE